MTKHAKILLNGSLVTQGGSEHFLAYLKENGPKTGRELIKAGFFVMTSRGYHRLVKKDKIIVSSDKLIDNKVFELTKHLPH